MAEPDANSPHFSQAPSVLLKLREKWRAYDTYLLALLIFAISRIVVVIGVNVGVFLARVPDAAKQDLGDAWYHRLLRWDSGWYAAIVNEGYRYSDDPSAPIPTVFYPLYPLVTYAVKSLFGIDPLVALLLVANLAALAATLLMTKFVKQQLGDDVALLSVSFFCFFPFSLFLSAGYTESLYLVFVFASFIMMAHEKFVMAAGLAALSLATRSTGIVLLPVLLLDMAARNAQPWIRFAPKAVFCGILAVSGLLLYMAYLGFTFGHPLAFATGQAAWQPGTFLDRFVAALMLDPFRHAHWSNYVGLLCFGALTIWSFTRLRFSVSLYGLGVLALPYLTLGITGSMNRFVLMCFPAFISMALLCKGRPRIAAALMCVFAIALLAISALFSQWYWVG